MNEVAARAGQAQKVAPWRNPEVRAIAFQILAILVLVAVGWYLVSNTVTNLENRGIRSGYDFLHDEAGFAIGEALIDYQPSDTYAWAFVTGLLNTLKVSVVGIVLATVIGTIVGIGRLSANWIVAKLCSVYVETVRNVPLLLQLAFWYTMVTLALPASNAALHPLPGTALSKSGLNYAVPAAHPIWIWVVAAFVAGVAAAVFYARWSKRRLETTGKAMPLVAPIIGCIVGLPLLVWLAGGAPLAFDVPQWQRFRFVGGAVLSPEYLALLTALTLYTAGFIAEIVRAGILAVPWGQWEASSAIGLSRGLALRLVILPQALRVIIPPMTSQYLNLTKNSSLAVAIGYPELVSITNTSLNQNGRAIECISIMMAIYLTISLAISFSMNVYNRRVALVER